MRLLIITFCSFLVLAAAGQVKDEKEVRLKPDEVPSSILESVEDYLDKSKKVKFFAETDNEKKSYEVKLQIGGSKYSIEFDESGKLEDIEKTIVFSSLITDTGDNITEHLNTYSKHRICKIQKQFSSTTKENAQVIEEALLNEKADLIRYELEVDIRKNGKWTSFEMLFSDDGGFISKRRIIRRSSEFILY